MLSLYENYHHCDHEHFTLSLFLCLFANTHARALVKKITEVTSAATVGLDFSLL